MERGVPCHHGMARPQVADGGDGLQVWRVAANILNKQSRKVEKGGPPAWGLGVGLANLLSLLRKITRSLASRKIYGCKTTRPYGRGR
jgi:hypothetical protein